MCAQSFRPFNQYDAVGKRIIEAKLKDFVRSPEAIGINMPELAPLTRIGLDQSECWTGDLFMLSPVEGANEGAGKAGFAGAKIAGEGDDVASSRTGCQCPRQARRCGLIGEVTRGLSKGGVRISCHCHGSPVRPL